MTDTKRIIRIPRELMQLAIRGYQKTVSPDHGLFRARYPHGFCRYYPSCSQYAHDAIGRYGAIKGSLLGIWRIMRCNPWSESRIDHVTENIS